MEMPLKQVEEVGVVSVNVRAFPQRVGGAKDCILGAGHRNELIVAKVALGEEPDPKTTREAESAPTTHHQSTNSRAAGIMFDAVRFMPTTEEAVPLLTESTSGAPTIPEGAENSDAHTRRHQGLQLFHGAQR